MKTSSKPVAQAPAKPPITMTRKTGSQPPAVQPVERDRPTHAAAPGLNDTMNRYLGTWSGSGSLATEMARVSNDPQFRQNPDQTQHAVIRAMGGQREDAEFRRTIGDTARSRAFSGLDDQSQLRLMERLGGADRAARDAYTEMWRSNDLQHANLAAQVGRLREFDRRQAERQEREQEERRQAVPPQGGQAPAEPAVESSGPLPPGGLLRAGKDTIDRVTPRPPSVAPEVAPPRAPADAPPGDPRAAAPAGDAGQPRGELPRVKRSELELGQHLGHGAHSNTYALGDREVAILFQQNARSEGSATHLTDQVEYMRGLQDVQFEGRSVAPGVSRFVTDDQGQVIGYVAERVRGEELGDITRRGGLDDRQFGEVQRQLRGQMDALHAAGRIHGDPNPGNVLVDVRADGSVEARFLDFERPSESFGAREDREVLERTLANADHSRQPEQVRQYWEQRERQRVEADRRKLVETERPRAEEARQQLRDLRRGLPETDEANRQLLQDVRGTLGMDGKEARNWTHDDFMNARQRLADMNAVERMRGIELTGDAARMRDDLVKNVEGFERGWQPPRAADPDGARRTEEEARRVEAERRNAQAGNDAERPPPNDPPRAAAGGDDPNRPGSGAQMGRDTVDDVVRHKIDEAYRNGPAPLRALREGLGPDHRRMLDDMLVKFDGNPERLQEVLQRDTNLEPDGVRRKLEGFDRGRAGAADRERARLAEARRKADELLRYPTTREYMDRARSSMDDAARLIDEVERAPEFDGRSTLLGRLRGEREVLEGLVDRDRNLGQISDKKVNGSANNLRGYGEEWADLRERQAAGHRVQYGGGADVVDHGAREAIQHKASASNDINQVRSDLQKANAQLSPLNHERPPDGYRRIINMTVSGESPLAGAEPGSAAHRQQLLDAAADAFDGQKDLNFDDVRFRYRDAEGRPVDVDLPRAEIEARIRVRGGDAGGRPQDDRPPPDRAPPDGARASADALHPDVRGAMKPEVLDGLSQDDLQRAGALTEDAGARQSVSDLLRNARSPEEARQILTTLEGVPAGSRQAVAQAIGAMGEGDPAQVHRMMQALPADSRDALGRVVQSVSREQGADLLRIAQHLEGRELTTALSTIDTAVQNLMRHAPDQVGNVGRLFTAMNQMTSRLGIQMTGQVAGRMLRGIGAMLPAAGTAFSAYDMARMGRVAADGTLPAELRFLGGAGVALNGMDTALGVAEMFGIGNVGLPANLALGASALGLDLYTHHQIDGFRADPDGWAPSRGLNAFVAGTALAMGPTGAALLVGTFGASGAQEKMLDLGQVGGELAINAARLGGVATADAAGGTMRFTARGIDALADAIRNPEQLGEAIERLGIGTQQLARNALGALGDATRYAGDLGRRAAGAIGQAGGWLAERGAEGLETLQWMARPENWPAMGAAAQRGITQMIQNGGELGRAALDGLTNMGERGVQMARHAIDALGNAGAQGLDMLEHAYRRFRANPAQAFRELGDAAIDGIGDLARQGGELGQRAVRSLIDWVNDQPRLAQRAVTTLRDLAARGGAALDEIGAAWSRNLTEGGRAVLASLENLGDAGAEALGRLGARGGQLAMESANALGRMVHRGYGAATQALQNVAATLSPENLQRFLIDGPARGARAVFDSLGGERIAGILNGLQDAPDALRRLYDRMDWGHVRDAFGKMGDQALTAMVGALDPRRLRELVGHFDAGFLRRMWDGMASWDGGRRLFEAAGEGLTRKLADAIGSHNIAGLVNAGTTSVEWIRTHLAQTLGTMQGFGDLLQRTTADGLRKLRDVVGVDRIAGTLRAMRDAGVQFGEDLVQGARALGDRTIEEAMGIAQRVQQHAQHVVRSYDNGIVHPFHPDAVWWIGRNPFRRR